MTSASPRSILVFSGRYHIISNASLVNNCIKCSESAVSEKACITGKLCPNVFQSTFKFKIQVFQKMPKQKCIRYCLKFLGSVLDPVYCILGPRKYRTCHVTLQGVCACEQTIFHSGSPAVMHTTVVHSHRMLLSHTELSCCRIRESPPQFENPLMARMYVRSIVRSTMYQKSSILFAGNGAVKISYVACGLSRENGR